MKTRFAFAGFRHVHILDLLTGVEERSDTEVVACCEEDAATRDALAEKGRVKITHTDFATMLREVDCDVIAIGDYYGKRGSLALAALRAGRHVLSDKPLCTSLAEQEEIERVAAERKLLVGLQLDSRDIAALRKLRDIILSGEIGEVASIHIDGQHPLLLGTRPGWYFEEGKHGGTINDIGVHAFDFVPWMTGHQWGEFRAVRSWNAKAREFPHFEDSAQFMATLDNGAGILCDFSYLAPDTLGYKLPHYWHLLVHGTRGLAETHLFAKEITVIKDSSTEPELIPVGENRTRGYLEDFLQEVRGQIPATGFTSATCLKASRLALTVQASAKA
ncbi:oxidoreductase domain protein [Chthoniobacter flavus Ellin428]|uniref:Oxidoreductase domain protein n=1 Tax=Chthoniobacter flavus Ellin428 TaxID=497964 RepID=B4D2P8_9BACT|nr:Gfo/Idh/MocA family oxidoreductase [Chthoniobacter flavus]EDY19488.1 oxidoreductase domain protein [Chthoniobacter flavus Ellin428]TCO90386.1 putative dehydrogenase [Chthoniobacter flavus]